MWIYFSDWETEVIFCAKFIGSSSWKPVWVSNRFILGPLKMNSSNSLTTSLITIIANKFARLLGKKPTEESQNSVR